MARDTTYELDVARGIDGLGPFEAWNELVASSPGGSFFQTAEWISAWWHELANRPELAVARVNVGGRLVAGAALARVRRPVVRQLGIHLTTVVNAGSGTGAGDHCGFPVCGGDARATELLWSWALGWQPDEPLLLSNLGDESPITPLAASTFERFGGEACPTTVLEPGVDFDAIRAGWSKNRRKTIGKKVREFENAGGRFEWVDAPDAVAAQLPTVFALHDARRAELGRRSRFGHDAANRAFHRRLASGSSSRSGCWVQRATIAGRVVGCLYGFRLDDAYSVYQSGWDPGHADMSLGLVQYAEALRAVVERGGRLFDMCRGDDAYKLRFATEIRTEASYLRVDGWRGRVLAQRLRLDDIRRARRSVS